MASLVGVAESGVWVFVTIVIFPGEILISFFNANRNSLICDVKIQRHWRRLQYLYFQNIAVMKTRPSGSCLLKDFVSFLMQVLLERDPP